MKRVFLCLCISSFIIGWRFSFYIDTDRQTKLTIGMDPRATSFFDRDIDKVAPPVPPEGSHSFFKIRDEKYSFIEGLWDDIRAIEDTATWKIITVNLERDITLLWIPDSLPEGDILFNDTLSLRQFSNGRLNIGKESVFTLVYKRKPTPTKMQDVTAKQFIFSIDDILPNPFNSTANINFSIPSGSSDVRISIFDITGHIVRELFTGTLEQGRYRIVWDGKDNNNNILPSGLYFVSLVKGDEKISKRVILMK